MASKYAQLTDCTDPVIVVTQTHLDDADVYVDGELWGRGINPTAITLPNDRLKTLAVNWAKRLAAIEGAIGGDNSPLIDRAKEYQKTAEILAKQLTHESLGVAVVVSGSGGCGTVVIGRG